MKNTRDDLKNSRPRKPRRAAVLVLFALLLPVLLGMMAFAIDLGYLVLTRTQLQCAADSAAMAGAAFLADSKTRVHEEAEKYAGFYQSGGKPIPLAESDVEIGVWDADERRFTPSSGVGNAVRVTARRSKENGNPLKTFFAGIFGAKTLDTSASAVAMANPRDIAFVVDLSGSMNDDTEPCWATDAVNEEFKAAGYSTIGNTLMAQLYEDFDFGSFPGRLEYVGEPFGAPKNQYAYAELTKNDGPLAQKGIPAAYRIRDDDSEAARKVKAYSAIIDYQLARLMPNAKPAPTRANYAYWERYLDYVMRPQTIRVATPKPPTPTPPTPSPPTPTPPTPSPPTPPVPTPPKPPKPPIGFWLPEETGGDGRLASLPGLGESLNSNRSTGEFLHLSPSGIPRTLIPLTLLAGWGQPPDNRGTLPPNQYGRRITGFNNPNKSAFPAAKSAAGWRNQLGYRTYVQFMLDFGRELQPLGGTYVPLSQHSPHCPWHDENTAGGNFRFPPRTQPMHAGRRALIAALEIVRQRNSGIVNTDQADWVTIISFDRLKDGGPVIEHPLNGDYRSAMEACTRLQAVSDVDASTATEAGLLKARQTLSPRSAGGAGREFTNKVVVLLTDGLPNLYVSDTGTINDAIKDSGGDDFYGGGYYWFDAPLGQTFRMRQEGWYVFPVGIGLGTNYDFMDRMARLGGTANDAGQSTRGSGNPAEYEKRLTEIFEDIITNPQVKLVQ